MAENEERADDSLKNINDSNVQHYPRQDQNLDSITLRELKLRNKQTQNAILAVQSRINYMKTKEEKTVKKVLNVKRKLTSLENVKHKAKQLKQMSSEQKRKMEENKARKSEFNKLIKDHLKYNKKIVMTLMNHKIGEEAKQLRDKKGQLQILTQVQRENIAQQNAEKANKVRIEHIEAHQKRKMYFLDKLQQFKQFKEQKLKEQLRQRERQQSMIHELEQKQRTLLERLSVSEKFRLKCQSQYEQARRKYHSFYEATKGMSRGISRDNSVDQSKADIFIS